MIAPATTLEVRGNVLPVLVVENVRGNDACKFRIKVLGYARPSRVELVHLRTTKRTRYAKVGINRFEVREGRGKALGHILCSPKGHMIEGHPAIYKSMKEALAMFRNDSPAVPNGLIENILRRK
jgi:hypothetical protein